MKKNLGYVDQIVRIVLALVIAVLYFLNVITGALAYILLGVAGIFILTSFIKYCPLYFLFGINTEKERTI